MILPTTNKEEQLLRIGHKFIAGVDEVGRGPLAGPVIAASVIFDWPNFKFPSQLAGRQISNFKNSVRDSKLLSERQRPEAYKWIIQNSLCWSVGIISQEEIDRIGIRNASLLAMAEAVNSLETKPDAVLIDGCDIISSIDAYQEPVIKGDRDIFSIAAASIIAKVSRDEIMKKYDKIFPQYGFAKHKGYGTEAHREAILEYGRCRLHRESFNFKGYKDNKIQDINK